MAQNLYANARQRTARRHFWGVVFVVATSALAGCTGPSDPTQSIPAEADVTYDGASNGSHSDAAGCDAEGTITGSGEIADGDVTVTVTDGRDVTLIERTFDRDFDLSDIRLDGHAGTWTLHVDRDGDDLAGDEFNGRYGFYLDCQAF